MVHQWTAKVEVRDGGGKYGVLSPASGPHFIPHLPPVTQECLSES